MNRNYVILDVFTDVPLGGNPLAVVLDTGGLGDALMQRIAREFNLSETVFVLPAVNPVHSARLPFSRPQQKFRSPDTRPSVRRCCSRDARSETKSRTLRR